jgi:hypothetical protein
LDKKEAVVYREIALGTDDFTISCCSMDPCEDFDHLSNVLSSIVKRLRSDGLK